MSGAIYSGTSVGLTRIAGALNATVNGEAINVSDVTYNPSSVKRETLPGQNRIAGFSEMPIPGKISFKVRDAGGLTVAAFNAMRDVSVVINLASGKTVYGDGCWTTNVGDVSTMDGNFDVDFEAVTVTESPV